MLSSYLNTTSDLLERTIIGADQQRRAKEYSPEALKITTDLLDLNPEFFTVWNYRRQILLALFDASYITASTQCAR